MDNKHESIKVDAESPSCTGVAPIIDQQGPSSIQVTITCTAGAGAFAANAAFAPTAGQFTLDTEGNMVPTGPGKGKGTPPKFNWQAKAVAPTLKILYTGEYNGKEVTNQDVTNLQVNVHAGWPIKLTSQLTPANANATYAWTIQGAGGNGQPAINGFIVAADKSSAKVVALVPGSDTKATFPDPANTPTMVQSYYYTKTGNFTASVQPQGVNGVTAKTTFIVAAPTSKMTATYQYPTRETTAGNGPAEFIYLRATNSLGLPAITYQQAGIVFPHPPVHSTTFNGHSYFVQVYTEDDAWYGILPVVADYYAIGTGLDGQDPYDVNSVDANGNDYVLDGPVEATDAQTNGLNYSPVTINDSPKMWVMYKPHMTGSIDVPLDSCQWHWSGTLTIGGPNLNVWTLTNQSPAAEGLAGSGATDKYPEWSQILPVPNPPR